MVENPWELDSGKSRRVSRDQSDRLNLFVTGRRDSRDRVRRRSSIATLVLALWSPLRDRCQPGRARRRCLNGRFAAGDPSTFDFADLPLPVDLVVACEML